MADPAAMPQQFQKCLKPDCMRKVTPGAAYCCEPCQIAATDRAPWEVGPYDPDEVNWVLVHTEFCEQRKGERGECTWEESISMRQVP